MATCPVLPPHPVGEQLQDGIKQETLAFGIFLKELLTEVIQEKPKTRGQQQDNCFGEQLTVH